MASKSRGMIEEGSVMFSHETEKTVNFSVTTRSEAPKSFTFPPQVKLTSVGSTYTLPVYSKSRLLYDGAGNYVPTYPIHNVSDTQILVTDNSTVNTDYSTLNKNCVIRARRLFGNVSNHGGITVPFDNSYTRQNSLVQLFFQARFDDWDDSYAEELFVFFVNQATINAGSQEDPDGASETQFLAYTVYINKNAEWRTVRDRSAPGQGDTAAVIEAREISDALGLGSGEFDNGEFYWFRVDIKLSSHSSGESIQDLKGFFFENHSGTSGEYVAISDVSVVIWEDNVEYWATSPVGNALNLDGAHNGYAVPISHLQNPDVGVTFEDVTTTSMKVITSAPFTGTIRYLCVVHG